VTTVRQRQGGEGESVKCCGGGGDRVRRGLMSRRRRDASDRVRRWS
jgi:hypothetical protein